MLRLFKLTFFLTFLAIVSIGAWLVTQRPTQILPLPYKINQEKVYDGQNEAQNAHILIIGDRMANSLEPFQEMINQKLSAQLREPLRVYNWAKNGEGLHRTLAKMKSLNKIPQVVLYLGSSQEFEEQRFRLEDSAAIAENFLRYEEDYILSLILTYPPLSRILYHPHKMLELSSFTPMPEFEDDKDLQRLSSLTYQIYRYELQELIKLIKQQNSQLILSTHPVNLEIEPKKICDHTQSRTQQIEQQDIKALLEAGRSKEAWARAQSLTKNSLGNPLNHYLKGQSAKEMGRLTEAQTSLQLAAVFDCGLRRSHAIFNNMIIQFAEKEDLYLINFDFLMNQNFARDELFLNELYPQNLYYQRFMAEFIKTIQKILNL